MKLKPQGRLEGSLLGNILKTKVAVIAANWVFQGMRYMNIYEITLKIILDLVLASMIMYFVFPETPLLLSIAASLVLAHTINWVINGHFFVLMRYVVPVPKTEQQFDDFIQKMKDAALKWKSLDGLAIYGSYCRGNLHKFSDLDVRVVTHPGIYNAVLGSLFCFYQRCIAFIYVFPLDVYCCDKMEFLDQLRDDETPHILFDHSGRLSERYGIMETSEGV